MVDYFTAGEVARTFVFAAAKIVHLQLYLQLQMCCELVTNNQWMSPRPQSICITKVLHRGEALVKPSGQDSLLRKKLAVGMGHNSYGEIAWPNDLLYMFPVCILGVLGMATLLAGIYPTEIGEAADPFATPLEILPEWFLLPTFQILRAIPNKVIGIVGMAAVPALLILVPFIETINTFSNPFRRPISTSLFMIGAWVAIKLGYDSLLPIG